MNGEQATTDDDGPVRSSHKGSHMTAPLQRIEVITRGERRRRWSIEEKREIVAESLGPGVRPSGIIRKHGITSGQLYAWRRQLTRRVDGPPARFAQVNVVAGERRVQTPAAPVARPRARAPARAARCAKGLIEIGLPGGVTVRVHAHVDDRALRCVLDALKAG